MRVQVRFFISLFILILFLSHQTFPQTYIPAGNVSGKWLKQNSPYYIDGHIKIPYGKKLIIEPGVKIIFNGHYKFIVNGILEANGAKNDSIYFTAANTRTGWFGLRFIEAEEKSIVSHCVFEYGVATANIDSLKQTEKYKNTPVWGEINIEVGELNGGAIFMYKSSPIIQNSSIRNNYAECNGGGIWIYEKSNPLVINCKIYNNTSNQFDGGGICCYGYSNPTIRNCIVSGNRTIEAGGGGIDITVGSNPLVENCIIENNIALNNAGICISGSSNAIIKDCLIRNNYALITGGMCVSRTNAFLINLTIENNTARDYCGGIYFEDTNARVEGITVRYNQANVCGGVQIQGYPRPVFSETNKSNVYLNIAKENANDFYTTSYDAPKYVILDTFTVDQYNELQVYPLDKMIVTADNFKITKSAGPLYISPKGEDTNDGTTENQPLKTLNVALTKILSDSGSPGVIYLDEGIYGSEQSNDILKLNKMKFVTLKGIGLSSLTISAEGITIFTPWWNSIWAFIGYILVIISSFTLFWNIRSRRIKIRHELELQKFESQKLHEIDEVKSRFFANISHEFRTPLTLILGPTKQLFEKVKDDKIKSELSLIHRNAKKLLELVNQLLDISKLESGNMKLQTSPVNIVSLLKALTLSFTSYAERKRITLKFNSTEDEIIVYVDKDKFQKIITNILSNAFKFTPEEGLVEVNVSRSDEYLDIKVSDTGIGIPGEKMSKIFNRFYQVDGSHTREQEGTGIGLSLTKELVELHKGKIEVESEEGKGTTVTVSFPLGKDHLKPEEISKVEEEYEKEKVAEGEPRRGREKLVSESYDETENKSEQKAGIEFLGNEALPLLLIVEDNSDVRNYIKDNLNKEYRVLEALDGEDGWNKSIEQIPDLIVSDVMMPKMDGFKLCEKLKTDERTSHIPIILLTAKASKEDKLAGYETGADEYLMKPFEPDELRARIKNLIEQRKRLHLHFQKEGLVELNQTKITPVDKKFLQQAYSIISQNISNESFGVEVFAKNLSVSKSLLHKKIVSLTGEPPVEFIRRIRLNKAAKLIENKFGNLSEIALEVGFNNPAYFSECFKKQFGIPPSQYLRNNETS